MKHNESNTGRGKETKYGDTTKRGAAGRERQGIFRSVLKTEQRDKNYNRRYMTTRLKHRKHFGQHTEKGEHKGTKPEPQGINTNRKTSKYKKN